jgi:hypothetical protein
MAQEFTREKLSVADAFGNPIYIGVDKTTIHTVPANSQDTITLYLKFGRVSRCEVTLFRSDGTNDYELPEKYMGSSGSIVPVEIKNVQAGNTIKAQLSGAAPNTTIYVTSGERTTDHVQTISRNSTYEIAIYDNKLQTGTPKYLTVNDFNWGSYTAPTAFQNLKAFKYFPDTGHLAMCISSGTGAGWWVHDIYENKVVFYSALYQHTVTQGGNAWVGERFVFVSSTPLYVIDFTDRANPTLSSNTVSQIGYSCYGIVKVSNTVFATISGDASYPVSTWILNSNNTVTHVVTESSPQYCYEVYAADTFADGNFYLAHFSRSGGYYGGLKRINASTGVITNISNSISSPFDSRYTCKVVACPERNEFWMFNGQSNYNIGKITTAGTVTSYTNTRAIASNVLQGRCFYDAADDLIYVMSNDNKWYGWDPDTQAWTRDSIIFTDSSWANNNYGTPNSIGVVDNGTNDILYGVVSTYFLYRNIDTNVEGFVNTNTQGSWNTAHHDASGRVYMCGQNNYLSVINTSGTPSLQQSYNASSYGSFSTYGFGLQVDQTNNKLYYSDYTSSLFVADINSTTGALTYNSEPVDLSVTTYREYPWVVDIANQYWYIFYSSQLRQYDLSDGSLVATFSISDLGINTGLDNYVSSFNYQTDANNTYGYNQARYDQANNTAYVSCYYYNGSGFRDGVMKLDLDQIGVNTSSTFAGFANTSNSSAGGFLSQFQSDGYLMCGRQTASQQYVVDTSTMTIERIQPVYATGTIYGRTYDNSTSAVYFVDSNGPRVEGQKYNAPAGEMPLASDFQVLTRQNYTNNNQAVMGSLGSHTPSDEDYSESTATQRAALDLDKGNGTTGHVNRVTTTA